MELKEQITDEVTKRTRIAADQREFVNELIFENARLKELLLPFIEVYDRALKFGNRGEWNINGVPASHFEKISHALRGTPDVSATPATGD